MTLIRSVGLRAGGQFTPPQPSTGHSVDFNGSNQRGSISYKSEFNITTNLSVEADCYLDAVNGNRTIISRFAASANSFILRVENGKLRFYCFIAGDWRVAVGATTIPTGTWVHLAGVYDGNTIKVYVDGVEDGSTTQTGNVNTSSTAPLEFAGTIAVGGEFFDGKLTNARLWSVNRSASLGTNITGLETGLVVALDQDVQSGSGGTWKDKSANEYDATLHNSPAWSADVP